MRMLMMTYHFAVLVRYLRGTIRKQLLAYLRMSAYHAFDPSFCSKFLLAPFKSIINSSKIS